MSSEHRFPTGKNTSGLYKNAEGTTFGTHGCSHMSNFGRLHFAKAGNQYRSNHFGTDSVLTLRWVHGVDMADIMSQSKNFGSETLTDNAESRRLVNKGSFFRNACHMWNCPPWLEQEPDEWPESDFFFISGV